MSGTKLVMGASGFLGSHVTRQLVERGDQVRVWIRESSSTVAFDDLDVERHHGDLDDDAALRAAMKDVDTVFYCIVDARAWLRDPAPLYATNVEALRNVLDAAVEVGVPKFVFCSTVGTIAIAESGLADETMPHNWRHLGGAYIESGSRPRSWSCATTGSTGCRPWCSTSERPTGRETTARPRTASWCGPRLGARCLRMRRAPRWRWSASRTRPPPSFSPRSTAGSVSGTSSPSGTCPQGPLRHRGRRGRRRATEDRHPASGDAGHRGRRRGESRGCCAGTRWSRRPASALMHIQTALDHSKATRELGWEPAPTAGLDPRGRAVVPGRGDRSAPKPA